MCEFCSYNGRTKENCYKLIGYPLDWPKPKKKEIGQYANQAGSYGEKDYEMDYSNSYDNSN